MAQVYMELRKTGGLLASRTGLDNFDDVEDI
jgi:hypothetical protein